MLPQSCTSGDCRAVRDAGSTFPGRIDLGLGRAPGSDQVTAQALRRNLASDPDQFPHDVIELLRYLAPAAAGQQVLAIPGVGSNVPLWILGSSLSAPRWPPHWGCLSPSLALRTRAAAGGNRALPYPLPCFGQPRAALRDVGFQHPGSGLGCRSALPGELHAAGLRQPAQRPAHAAASAARGLRNQLAVPAKAMLADVLACSAIGSADTVRSSVAAFIARTRPDELWSPPRYSIITHACARTRLPAQIQKGGTRRPDVSRCASYNRRAQSLSGSRMVDARKLRVASEVPAIAAIRSSCAGRGPSDVDCATGPAVCGHNPWFRLVGLRNAYRFCSGFRRCRDHVGAFTAPASVAAMPSWSRPVGEQPVRTCIVISERRSW